MVRASAVILLLLASCAEKKSDDDADRLINEIKIGALMNRVQRLENSSANDYVAMREADGSWAWLNDGNLPVRVGWRSVEASGNGSEVELSIGNPLSMSLRDCTIEVDWGETDKSGMFVQTTAHHKVMRIAEAIPAGGFAWPKFKLADIPPSKLGMVTVQRLYCLRMGA